MNPKALRRICITPQLSGVGGMVSFQHKLVEGLQKNGVDITYDLADTTCQAVLVIGGTRHAMALWRLRRRGVRIVQRLNGMNWLHRLPARPGQAKPGLRHFLRAEYGNRLLTLIRNRLAQHIVYQSQFARRWWEDVHGAAPAPASVVYNGVDLATYAPQGREEPPGDRWRVLMVEGSLAGGYEQGLEVGARLVTMLHDELKPPLSRPVELMVVGRVAETLARYWEDQLHPSIASGAILLTWAGLVERVRIPEFDRAAHLLYSADVNAACPNSVIEALACGLPVLAFATGALPEMIAGDSGRVVDYGGDPWRLEPPDVHGLARAAGEILAHQQRFRSAARARAETLFGLDRMVAAYQQILMGE